MLRERLDSVADDGDLQVDLDSMLDHVLAIASRRGAAGARPAHGAAHSTHSTAKANAPVSPNASTSPATPAERRARRLHGVFLLP